MVMKVGYGETEVLTISVEWRYEEGNVFYVREIFT